MYIKESFQKEIQINYTELFILMILKWLKIIFQLSVIVHEYNK